jgi:hypothetical protein
MAKADKKLVQEVSPSSDQAEEQKIRFLEWFSSSLNRFKGLQAHHMTAVRAYFIGIGIPDPAAPSAYDEGMEKFGLERI